MNALVTGAAGGIGAAIARTLAARGMDLVLADIDAQAAQTLAGALGTGGLRALGLGMDVTDASSVRVALEQAREEIGEIDVLVNNAGWDELRPFLETAEPFWRQVLEINYLGALRLTRELLPGMVSRGYGRIVCVASDAGRVGSTLESVYAGAKGAVIAFAKSIARESARDGVTVNVVCPGPVDTPLLASMADSPEGRRWVEAVTRAVPMRRLARPEDVARAVAFFCEADAGYVTGQTLSVSGGLTMA